MIVFNIGEHRFGIEASLFSFLYASLSFQTFIGLLFEVVVIERCFYYAIALLLIASAV